MTFQRLSHFMIILKFINHKPTKLRVKASDHFQAVSLAVEKTQHLWPAGVQRPVSIMSCTGDEQQLQNIKYYRITKKWKLVEEPQPYTTFAGERHG